MQSSQESVLHGLPEQNASQRVAASDATVPHPFRELRAYLPIQPRILPNSAHDNNVHFRRLTPLSHREHERERRQRIYCEHPTFQRDPASLPPMTSIDPMASTADNNSAQHSLPRRQQREQERQERHARNLNRSSPTIDTAPTFASPRAIGQRLCRERERHLDVNAQSNNRRSIAQRARRERKRQMRNGPSRNAAAHAPRRAPARRSPPIEPLAWQPYREPLHRHDLGRMEHECRHCHALHWLSEKIGNSTDTNPEFPTCCDHGKVKLPNLEPPPEQLMALFTGSDPQSRNFREYIWEYNRALAFTSLGVNQDHTINDGRSMPVFRIQGELCHLSGALLPAEGQQPTYAQLYIYDPRTSLRHRMQNNAGSNLRADTMSTLQDVIRQYHQYAPVYLQAYEILRDYETDDVCIQLRVDPRSNLHRYNLPTVEEVAVILPNDPSRPQSRDIILRKRGGRLQQISELHPAYAPLQYVLLFPRGENGWHPDLRVHDPHNERPHRKRLTLTRFVAYCMHNRRRESSALLRGGRLLQRYLVDMWAAADQNTLRYYQMNQGLFRSHVSNGLADAINQADGDVDLSEIGQHVILPSSYPGGPRNMHQRFQDSMAMARYFKKVDLFLTMTCNPRWDEITRELHPGETAYDRPDLVSRVFQLKKKALLHDILKEGVLGRVVAHVYTIEFQKRGLPHMHLLIFFQDGQKLLTSEEIDKLIWARWPDPQMQPLLFETVKSNMVHGPCGPVNPSALCMDQSTRTCTKRYPKPFTDSTNMDVNGYPEYYRPCNGSVYNVGAHAVDNRWIVPYCPFLSAKYNCHINVECTVSLSSFKYVFKYIQKGGDMATMGIYRHNEIKRWINGRYISASEAAWRLFHFDTHEQDPPITRLQIHLPGQHMVVFDPNEPPETVAERAAAERTTLTAFFEANADPGPLGDQARKLTYQEFPQLFTWVSQLRNRRKNYWKLRESGFALGRMYFVPPTGGERFYLRTLLTVVKGPTSFEDLRTYRGQVYTTFQEACLARGLLEDDNEWEQCLREASMMQTGYRLRQLFVTLLLFCDVSQPALLWQHFREHICDDLCHRLETLGLSNISEEQIYDYGLYLLNKQLQETGRSLADWPTMPQPVHDWDAHTTNALIAEQLNYSPQEQQLILNGLLPTLNHDQRNVYNAVIDCIENCSPQLFFANGPGGTGKTYVYTTICAKLRSDGAIVLAVASSGIAALLLPGGRTAHSMFKIPIDGLSEESLCNISKNSPRAELLRRTNLIIWDEAGMQHHHAIEALDRSMRDIRGVDEPFGATAVLFGGDWEQCLPVIERGSREEIIDSTLQRSYLWQHIHVLHLRENMRLQRGDADRDFAHWLLDIGHGRNISDDGTIPLPPQMISPSPMHLIHSIYPSIDSVPPPPREYFFKRMILAPRNNDVADINETILNMMSGEEKTYFSADKVLREPGADDDLSNDHDKQPIPVEFLCTINEGTMPPGELTLKVGCPVILLRNLNPACGLCNGTQMIISRMDERVLEVILLGGDHDGEIALIPRITVIPRTASSHHSFKFSRRQFPVCLAFALTINKAQGQSVKNVGLDLRIPVFGHGQLYVALSRATSSTNVHILLPDNSGMTKNVVYPEVLLD